MSTYVNIEVKLTSQVCTKEQWRKAAMSSHPVKDFGAPTRRKTLTLDEFGAQSGQQTPRRETLTAGKHDHQVLPGVEEPKQGLRLHT